jgi:putative hydrolase of the HAD superfamily
MRIRGVILDLDDTLYSELSYVHSGFRAVDEFLAESQCCQPEEFYASACLALKDGYRKNIFDRTMLTLGVSSDRFLIADLVRIYRDHFPTIDLFEDAKGWLERNTGHYLTGIITDGFARAQRRKISALGLSERISCIVYSDDYGPAFWKPHVKPYREIELRLNLSPNSLVYVGDNPRKDFKGARDAGWRSVRIRRSGTLYHLQEPQSGFEPDAEVGSFDDLEKVLATFS